MDLLAEEHRCFANRAALKWSGSEDPHVARRTLSQRRARLPQGPVRLGFVGESVEFGDAESIAALAKGQFRNDGDRRPVGQEGRSRGKQAARRNSVRHIVCVHPQRADACLDDHFRLALVVFQKAPRSHELLAQRADHIGSVHEIDAAHRLDLGRIEIDPASLERRKVYLFDGLIHGVGKHELFGGALHLGRAAAGKHSGRKTDGGKRPANVTNRTPSQGKCPDPVLSSASLPGQSIIATPWPLMLPPFPACSRSASTSRPDGLAGACQRVRRFRAMRRPRRITSGGILSESVDGW